ncbi:MAG TPA: GNAT family N-acetyltransferase [Gemmatimonadales bacterium]
MAKDPVIRIRRARATAADLDRLAPLFEAYRDFYHKPRARGPARRYLAERLRRGESVVFLAELGRTSVGFVQLYPGFSSLSLGRAWVLNDLYVAPEARRHGAARLLMEAARRHGIRTGAVRIELATAKTNRAARALYDSLGYECDDEFDYLSLRLR